MNKKIRILWCGESSHIPSGFGNYTREVLTRLYNSNQYEIAELSCYRNINHPKTEPWKIYPVGVDNKHPLYQQYVANPINQFGLWRFELAVVDFKPDIVIDVRDFWNFSYQESSCLRPFYSWIIAPTYDSTPPKIETLNTFKNADMVLFHTEWAQRDLSKFNYNNDINIGGVINDSVDPDIFKPIEDKAKHKMKFGMSDDMFIIGTVMRNQKRKLIPDLIQSFAQIKAEYKNAVLYLHTSYPEKEGWNLPSLLLEYDIANSVYLTYRCSFCKEYWPSLFAGSVTKCKGCGRDATVCGLHNAISASELNNIYNLFDVYVQYAICEGFGIPQVEAASCGIPIITVNYGAMSDVGSRIGAKLVNIASEFRELETEAMRSYADNKQLVKHIKDFIKMLPDDLIAYGIKTRQLLLDNFSWQKTTQDIINVINNIDISKNRSWDTKEQVVNYEIKIPTLQSNRDFIYYLIDHILHDSFLKKTSLIENMIKDLDAGIVVRNTHMTKYTRTQAVKELEIYINNKIGLEKIRVGTAKISDQFKDFINY